MIDYQRGHRDLARLQSQTEFLHSAKDRALDSHRIGAVLLLGHRSIQQRLHERLQVNQVAP